MGVILFNEQRTKRVATLLDGDSMGYIATYFALRVIDVVSTELDGKPFQQTELCKVAGINPGDKANQKSMITDDAFFSLLEHVAGNFDKGYTIAIRVGATMCCNDYGAFGLAFKTACNLSGSFLRVERYGKVVTSIANYSMSHGSASAFMTVKRGLNNRLGLLLTNELAVAAATALCREVSRTEFAPTSIHFSHAAPADISDYENYFQCPVIFGSDKDGLEICNDKLHAGNQLGDQAISAFFDNHLDAEIANLVDESRIDQQVSKRIIQALSEGIPTINAIAQQLAMSRRTLQRRLSECGFVYQELVDDTRRKLALQLFWKKMSIALQKLPS